MGSRIVSNLKVSRYSLLDILTYTSFTFSYFFVSNILLELTFLNLTPNRFEALDLPFYVDSSSVTLVADVFSVIISALLVTGIYQLQKGTLSPRKTDIAYQIIAVIAFLPLLSYFFLHIMWLLSLIHI